MERYIAKTSGIPCLRYVPIPKDGRIPHRILGEGTFAVIHQEPGKNPQIVAHFSTYRQKYGNFDRDWNKISYA